MALAPYPTIRAMKIAAVTLDVEFVVLRLRDCGDWPMLFMPHDAYVGGSLDLYGCPANTGFR